MGGMGENQKRPKKRKKGSPTCNYLEFSMAKVADEKKEEILFLPIYEEEI